MQTVREGERDVAEGRGRMVTRIMAAVDAEYTEVTRVRIRRAMRQLAAEGRPCGGRLFGYIWAVDADGRKTRAIVPHEAQVVRWAAAELLRGETLASVARAFDAKGNGPRQETQDVVTHPHPQLGHQSNGRRHAPGP